MSTQATSLSEPAAGDSAPRRRTLIAACSAHAVHDGLSDLIYVLLPLWQTQFAVSYAMIGFLRASYSGVMAGFQLLASRLARRFGRERMLIGGTALAGAAYLLAGAAGGLPLLMIALMLGGLGASTQHPLASSLVTDAYEGAGVKQALSQYNFSGDIGKTLIPGAAGLLLVVLSWQASVTLIGLLGLAAALLLWWLLPSRDAAAPRRRAARLATGNGSPAGLRALLATGTLDSTVRMGLLTFLPFLLKDKGAGTAGIGLALSLLFIGGAFGKLFCGYLGARVGMMKTVWATESLTSLCVVLAVFLPLTGVMIMLPLLGLALNGTSSVLYGVVPELAAPGKHEQAFAWFYTGTIGAGALSPVLFGKLGDVTGVPVALVALAVLLLGILPLSWRVQKSL